LLHPIDVQLSIFSNRPIICQIVKLLAHIETALKVSAEQNRQVDLVVHVNNRSNSEMGLLIGEDRIPPIHGSTQHFIGDGTGV